MKNLLFLSVFAVLFFTGSLSAQKLEKATVVQFEEPFDAITVSLEEGGKEVPLVVNDKTLFHDKKGKDIKHDLVTNGTLVTIIFEIEQTEGDEEDLRVAKEIKLVLEVTNKVVLKGLLEYRLNGKMAMIDGRAVKLDETGEIKGDKKAECKCKGMVYTSFKDKLLKLGSYIKAEGEMQEDGFFHAKLYEVCENTYTPSKRELRKAIDGRIDTSKMTSTLTASTINIGSANYALMNDAELNELVNRVGKKIMPSYLLKSETEGMDFRFYVIDNAIPNAFAYPNGMVFVHKGLLEIIENEAQLAFVLGHEIAHVSYDHGIKKLQESKANERNLLVLEKGVSIMKDGKRLAFMDKIVGKFFPSADVSTIGTKALVSAFRFSTQMRPAFLSNLHGKENEEQADRIALMYMNQAGYDIRETPKLWKKMMDATETPTFKTKLVSDAQDMFINKVTFDKENPWASFAQPVQELIVNKLLETVYSSHPQTKKRFDNANRLISTHYKNNDYKDKIINSEKFGKVKQDAPTIEPTAVKNDE